MRDADDRRLRDEALLRRIRRRPQSRDAREAMAELLLQYRGSIYQWCYRYVRHHDRAVDLAQEVILETCQALPGFHGRASFSSWLFAITRNRCVSALRRLARTEPVEYDLELLPDSHDGPDLELERQEERERVLKAMRTALAPHEQEALCLRVFDNLPVEAITEVLGLETVSGARSVLQNARRKLRAALA